MIMKTKKTTTYVRAIFIAVLTVVMTVGAAKAVDFCSPCGSAEVVDVIEPVYTVPTTTYTVSTPVYLVPTTNGMVQTAYRPILLGNDLTYYETNSVATYQVADEAYW